MKITGHRTDSVYRRHGIVNEADIEQALATVEAAVRQSPPSKVASLSAARLERQG
jgi:hypothetical protein